MVAAAGAVRQILALRDDALETHFAGVPVHCRAVLVGVLAVAERRAGGPARHNRAQQRLAVDEGCPCEIEAIEIEQIEDVVTEAIWST